MGRTVAMLWHAAFSIGAGVLYFLFVMPRWTELMGETGHTLGTALRIVAGVLIGLAALPVVFTHVLAGALIIGTAISEIWLSLDAAGRWLFGIYGAAAAIAVLGFFAFYLSFVAELPPPPPKPIKAKKPKKSAGRRKKGADEADETDEAETEEVDETETAEADQTEEAETQVEEAPVAEDTEDTRAGLQNRRPTGKGSHRMRRRSSPGGIAVKGAVEE